MPAAPIGLASELRLRVLSSLVLGALALLSAWAGGWIVAVVWLGAAIAVAYEWVRLTRCEPGAAVTLAIAAGLCALLLALLLAPLAIFVAVLIAGLAVATLVAKTPRDKAWAAGGFLYAAPVALVPVMLRVGEGRGVWPLLWMFAVVWTTDVAAYFVGRAVGGPKLWPAVSPKKTWAGFVGGLLAAVLAGSAVGALASTRQRFGLADGVGIAVLSAIASVASQAGDLAESAMKRHFDAKDSGTLIPGHGGVLDRLDGFAAVALLMCVLIPLAQVSLWTVAP